MTHPDKRIGQALLTARGNTTQQAVADAMRERGHKWSQATVWSVEKGERPLRLTEANDLTTILGVTIADLSVEPSELEASLLMRRHADKYSGIVDATNAFFAVQMEIEELLEQVERGDRKMQATTVAGLELLALQMPERAIDDVRRRNAEHLEAGVDNAEDQHVQGIIDWERGK